MRVANDLTELIGQTPLLALDRLYPRAKAKVYAKLEMFNPMSNKDRPVLHMIREAKARGTIGGDTEVVEASQWKHRHCRSDPWRDHGIPRTDLHERSGQH